MPIVTVDGNIGSGKSTVLNYIHRNHKIPIDLEPIENWKSYLENFYNNKNSIFNLQLRVWLDRAWIQEKEEKVLLLMERSPFLIKKTFNVAAHMNDNLNDNEFQILNELYNKTDSIWNSNYYIYLRSNPNKCIERVKSRGRKCEENITLEYLQQLHNLHEINYKYAIENNYIIYMIDIEEKDTSEISELILEFIKKNNLI